jgi:hypothetical protein
LLSQNAVAIAPRADKKQVQFWLRGGINEKVRPGKPLTMGHKHRA